VPVLVTVVMHILLLLGYRKQVEFHLTHVYNMKPVQLNQLKEVAKEDKQTFNAQILINAELVIHFLLKEEDAKLYTNIQMLQLQNTEEFRIMLMK